MNNVTSKDMAVIQEFVETNCGIRLDETKAYLVESRLGPILPMVGVGSYTELILAATRERTGNLKHKIIDSITTNETYFFRDNKPFELLAHKLLPEILERRFETSRPSIRIWSAASSTGQEIYSIAMVAKELLGNIQNYDIRLTGTDISQTALEIASRGLYGKLELARGLTGTRLKKHFTPADNLWRIHDELRAIVTFRHMNLLTGTATIPQQDLIFCRNVAFYFSKENKQLLFNNLAQKLPTGGVLVIGSTESLVGMELPFEKMQYHGNIYYQKK